MATRYHAEHVGSLLRPSWLLDARAAHKQGALDAEALREAEDRAALQAIELQRDAGIEVFTDGEMRRDTWMAGFFESTGGVTPVGTPRVPWHRAGGDPPVEDTDFDSVAATGEGVPQGEPDQHRGQLPGRARARPVQDHDDQLVDGRDALVPGAERRPSTRRQASWSATWSRCRPRRSRGLIDQGVSWIQLDSLGYNQVFDADFRAATGLAALPPEAILNATVTADAALVRAAKRRNPDVTVGMHICRGNNRSAWMAQGSYEPVAERLFGEVGVDRFLLEYDTERAGGFAPLRFIRPGTTVVLGLVSSKLPQLESPDELRRRIDEAARYVPIADLALSPQCGFASTSRGNQLTVDEERRKLELVASTASKIWA